MSVNGVDVTEQFIYLCGSSWLLIYFGTVLFVLKFKPKTKNQRRWKASLLFGGLPVLAIPLLMGLFSIVPLLQKIDTKAIAPDELFREMFTPIMSTIVCMIPISVGMSIIAIFAARSRMKFSDALLNKIVPPQKEEKPNVHDWL